MDAAAGMDMIEDLVNQGDNSDLDFDNAFEDDQQSIEEASDDRADLLTHDKIKTTLCGTIIKLDKGYAKTTLQTTTDMALDDIGLIHSGFIYAAADYAAAVAVNEPNTVIIDNKSKFFAPAKLNDLIVFEAKAKFEDTRKREIKVIGKINDIKVYEGVFHAVILAKHILKTTIKDLRR